VIGVGIEGAVARFYFDYESEDKRKTVISSAVVGYGSVAVILILSMLPFCGLMARVILDSSDHTSLFILALSALALGIVMPIFFTYMRVRQKSFQYMITNVIMSSITLSLHVYFIAFAKLGVFGLLLSNLIVTSLFTVILGYITLKQTGFKVDYRLLWNMLKFSLPLIPASISGFVVHTSDRYFIKTYFDLTSTGLYSLGYKFGVLIHQLITSPFIQIWNPRRIEYFGKEGYERIYARIFTYFCCLTFFAGLMISLLSKEVIYFMTTEPFWPAYKIIPLSVLSQIVFSFSYHFNVGIIMEKATKYLAYINVANGILNLILNFILIKKYNIWGAAGATLICFIFKAYLTYYFSNRFHKIYVEWSRIIMLFLISMGLYFLGFMTDTGSIWIDMVCKLFIGCAFPVVLYLTRFFDSEEVKRFKHIIKTRKLDFD
jgi:O-antigen/teichoic acid export membrane protein